jgi:exodeoxyribonuclease VII large subunit
VEQLHLLLGRDRKYLTVTEFTDILRGMLEEVFPDVWIAGEISGAKSQPSGHIYFTLKDGEATVSCVAYRNAVRYLKFKPQDGVAVLARGRVDIWPPSGRYQLIVEALEPQGRGALQFAFEQLKHKLTAEGLFDESRKRPIPVLPQRIGIVTSPTGAVIQDMLQILERRFAGLHIRLFPAAVQGEGSAEQVCRGIEYFSKSAWPDVIIVARGGGSLEDLWTFNEESVARAIAASNVPVITAIGHETDYTIADFVADLRAPTPSAAADLVIQSKSRLQERLLLLEGKLQQNIQYRFALVSRRLNQLGIDRAAGLLRRRLGRLQQRNDELDFHLRDRIRDTLQRHRRRLDRVQAQLRRLDIRLKLADARRRQDSLQTRLQQLIRARLTQARARLENPAVALSQLSPLKILDRGYALIVNESGVLVKSPQDAPPKSRVKLRVAKGSLQARIEED